MVQRFLHYLAGSQFKKSHSEEAKINSDCGSLLSLPSGSDMTFDLHYPAVPHLFLTI